jgi:Spy/CpxP family protein refolding chaperone
MTAVTRWVNRATLALVAAALAITSVSAQAPPPPPQAGGQAPQRPLGKGAPQRQPGEPAGQLNLQEVQNMVDTWALVEAEKDLGLTNAQYPDFVARMRRLQSTRRRHMAERQRTLRELNAMVFTSPRPDDNAIAEKLKAFDLLGEKAAQEMRQVTQELDAILTPFQRAQFRVFEERMERRKIDMLTRARAARGGGAAPAGPPAKGRGGH